jgi:hypothetical protein
MPSVLPTPTQFDAAKHVAYVKPEKKITMSELGFEGKGISPVAISAPFPLFSPEGVKELRREGTSSNLLPSSNCLLTPPSDSLLRSRLRRLGALLPHHLPPVSRILSRRVPLRLRRLELARSHSRG